MNMDYTLCQALKYNSDGIPRTVVCYDIACQFFTHFEDRVQNNPYLSLPRNMTIEKAIGQFHIHGHQDDCFPKYSPNFIPGIGQVDGEIIETLWSQLNEVSGSTRSMSMFHRRETLNDHMNDSNWKKLLQMVSALIRKFKHATRERKIAETAFLELSNTADPHMVNEWRIAEAKAVEDRLFNLDAMKIFDISLAKGSNINEFGRSYFIFC
jgi:Kyakuja-Dileera-Zisupton transposase